MAIIHKFQQNGIKMLLDANSGAFHIIDDIVFDIIDYYKVYDEKKIIHELSNKHCENDIVDGIKELERLEQEGLLYSDDPYEKIEGKNGGEAFIKAMCLNIAHDCNLKCKYCFAQEGEYNGKRSMMPETVAKAAIDFIIKKSGPRRNIEVDLFGGEPLMNLSTVKSVVAYGKQQSKIFNKEIRFTITTNATLLNDDIIAFLDDNMTNIVLSIDGREKVNDYIRVRADGRGTYEDILPKIKKMVAKRTVGKQYYVRGTFTANNIDFFDDVIELSNSGFKEISIEPVVLPEENELSIKEKHLNEIFNQYEKLTNEIINRKGQDNSFKFYHFAIDINGGPCIYKRISGCGAGFEYIAVTPEGDIYPCHQFVGNEKFKMGTVYDDAVDNNISSQFKNGHIYEKEDCRNCWAKFYCSGGCQANNYNFNGSILKPYKLGCALQKKRIECALTIKASQYIKNEE